MTTGFGDALRDGVVWGGFTVMVTLSPSFPPPFTQLMTYTCVPIGGVTDMLPLYGGIAGLNPGPEVVQLFGMPPEFVQVSTIDSPSVIS
jgi:hypothetical protein